MVMAVASPFILKISTRMSYPKERTRAVDFLSPALGPCSRRYAFRMCAGLSLSLRVPTHKIPIILRPFLPFFLVSNVNYNAHMFNFFLWKPSPFSGIVVKTSRMKLIFRGEKREGEAHMFPGNCRGRKEICKHFEEILRSMTKFWVKFDQKYGKRVDDKTRKIK